MSISESTVEEEAKFEQYRYPMHIGLTPARNAFFSREFSLTSFVKKIPLNIFKLGLSKKVSEVGLYGKSVISTVQYMRNLDIFRGSQTSPSGSLIHMRRYFRIWTRFRRDIGVNKKLRGVIDTAESSSVLSTTPHCQLG